LKWLEEPVVKEIDSIDIIVVVGIKPIKVSFYQDNDVDDGSGNIEQKNDDNKPNLPPDDTVSNGLAHTWSG
jgi:hypothetical protein